ncbi:probable serine/threonine-protein kinase DDB_G0282963 [Condylostylus longicornis]|uniref:probable serine/threonine-protein kinase DDB_G0282963 n=1 Tax=Condylostylus longicornis TaxID=2530218 RepID=UPI00244DDC18|nr:probable serine/threonine-protein kinase DDB_G0282963 [Condylostylus longicornis]
MAETENSFSKLNDLSTIILKGSPNPSERDAGFCSGSSEVGDDTSSIDNASSQHNHHHHNHNSNYSEHHHHHHTDHQNFQTEDSSEDSVEVKITPISYTRNKRKSTEPSRVILGREETGPLKKRVRYHTEEQYEQEENIKNYSQTSNNKNIEYQNDNLHFRPWDESQCIVPHEKMPNPAEILVRHPGVTTLHRNLRPNKISNDIQDEPLALITKKSNSFSTTTTTTTTNKSISTKGTTVITTSTVPTTEHKDVINTNNMISSNSKINTQKITTLHSSTSLTKKTQNNNNNKSQLVKVSKQRQNKTDLNTNSNENNNDKNFRIDIEESDDLTINNKLNENLNNTKEINNLQGSDEQLQRPIQRNYKNMTRERRIEANARERTRVHTISAAYDTLRKSVPAYSNSQKLSKLSVLRVACSYILTLSRMAGLDYSEDQSSPSLASCVDMVTKTIQTEGKIRKKKDE